MLRQGKACQIWEAIRDSDNVRCVLKILRDEYRRDKEELAILKHEYTVGRELDHENCISVFEFDIARGIPFVALELFDSLNLKQWIRSPSMQQEWLPSIFLQSANGLKHLHEQGWVHRDVKPDNLLVNNEGKIKLIDFAIAQKMKRGLGRLLGGRGKVQGTRSYMSPEQIRNETLDQRSDIYSFGCVMFELVTGKPPFTGSSADELLERHLKSPVPSLMAHSDSATESLANLVARTMAKRREQRPESMAELIALLKEIRQPIRR